MNHLLGTLGFMSKRKMRGEDKKKERHAGSGGGKRRGHNIDGKRQEKHKRATSVKHLGGSFGTLPPARGHKIRGGKKTHTHGSNAGIGGV